MLSGPWLASGYSNRWSSHKCFGSVSWIQAKLSNLGNGVAAHDCASESAFITKTCASVACAQQFAQLTMLVSGCTNSWSCNMFFDCALAVQAKLTNLGDDVAAHDCTSESAHGGILWLLLSRDDLSGSCKGASAQSE